MPRTNAFIPVAKGIDQRLDERLRAPDSLGVLTNAQYVRNNAVRKRHGFSVMPTTVQSFSPDQNETGNVANQGTPRGLFSTGTELCVRGYRSLYAYVDGKWINKGALSPFTGTQTTPFVGAKNIGANDVATNAAETFHVATTQELSSSVGVAGGWNTAFVYQVRKGDQEVVPTTTIASASGIGVRRYNSPRVIWTTDEYMLSVQKSLPALNDQLEWYQSDGVTVTGPWLTINDLWGDPAEQGNFARHDSCPFSSPSVSEDWAYCYIKAGAMGANGIYVATYNGQTLGVSTIIPQIGADPWVTCAISWGASNGKFYVVGMADNGVTRLYTLEPTALTITSTMTIARSGNYAAGCAVTEGTAESNVQIVVALNSADATNPSRRYLDLVLTDGTVVQDFETVYNTYAVSEPWFKSGRCYIAAKPRYGDASGIAAGVSTNDDGYSGEVILDLFGLRPPPTPGRPELDPNIVGRYNFGVTHEKTITNTVSGEWDMVRGALANVTTDTYAPNKVRYATQRIVNKVPLKAPMKAGDVIEVDYAGTMLQQATTRGTATIAGGSVNWYAGRRVEELGYASGPFAWSFTATNSALGKLAAGTYFYQGVFECYDEAGSLVRSVPGPVAEFTFAGGGGGATHYVTLRFYNLGASSRFIDGKQFKIAVYRASSNGVFSRCVLPIADTTVLRTQPSTLDIVDLGDTFEPIYTQSGAELEAAGPDGAAYVTTTSQRVWLAGFFRRDRIQYSKPYNAATANEYAIAPEFNDGFAYLTPGGQTITGVSEMDDKVIVFTDSSIYAIAGNGPDDGGRNNDFSGLQLINSDTGCIEPRSIVSFPGGVMFRAPSGIFVLGRDFQLTFLGAQVRDITDEYTETTSACLVPEANHVRFTLRKAGEQSLILCYDLDQGAWLKWEPKKTVGGAAIPLNIVGSCLHQRVYYVLDATGTVWYEDATAYKDHGTIYVPMTIATSWLQGAGQSAWQRVRQVASLCKSRDPHDLTISLYQDFAAAPSQAYTWTAATIAQQKLNELVTMRAQTQKCTSFKIEIADTAAGTTVTGEGYECGGFTVELSGKAGLYKPGTQQRN